ncbi:MAG: nuclear transport factor 2 family protein [Oscillospiraceae bacterium]|nr:nuclear transport factor 2 family protein [Oscillospiraceae bacterium]
MVNINQYIEAMEKKDTRLLGSLFAADATYKDTCPEVAGLDKYQCHGREGIDMFFRNQFIFRKFSLAEPQIMSDKEALFVGVYGNYYLVAVATILDYDAEGNIRNMVVRPA